MTKAITHRSRIATNHNGSHSAATGLISQARTTIQNVDVKALRERLSSTITAAQKKAKAVAKGVRQQASRADDAIRAKPYHAMAIAGGVGLVAGLLIARRRAAK
jgi:ElaB/YqjD/DUF883 family membrane-anchored ribosome-binding protein